MNTTPFSLKKKKTIKLLQASRAIHKIRSENGNILTDAKAINKRFADFHSKVYKSKGEIDINALNQFLTSTNLPTLSEETSNLLEGEITLEEIKEVIIQLPNNKCVGPDGFSA